MDGYSKIKLEKRTKSRSIDISDLFPKFTENISLNQVPKTLETKQIQTHESPPPDEVYEHGNRDLFGMKLSRSCSVSSSTSSHIFRFDKKSKTKLPSAVKRVFSMRRSSSVSERYCRIHDQCVTLASPLNDDDDDVKGMGNDEYPMQAKSIIMNNKKRSSTGRIFKACKSLFRL